MNNSFVDRFIDQRDRRAQEIAARLFVGASHGYAELFDLRSQFTAAAPVYLIARSVLPDPLFC
jgi:hypothetical protein